MLLLLLLFGIAFSSLILLCFALLKKIVAILSFKHLQKS